VDPDRVGPTIFFQPVPEPKVVKNRLHIDIKVSRDATTPLEERHRRIEAGVQPLVLAGARMQRRSENPDDYFIVMQDPEGNEFCLV
jgi:Glyoxalase-like domain